MERRWKVLALVSVGVFMVSLDLFIVNIAFPEIEGDFAGSSVSTISWVLNAYAIVIAALMVSGGRLADRHGRKRLFLWGLGIFVLGSALCGAAPSVETLVAARVIQAAGAALTACLARLATLSLICAPWPTQKFRRSVFSSTDFSAPDAIGL